jgi:preprotein translocase subunit SecD
MKSFGARINILIIMLILSVIAIAPRFDAEGVEISSLDIESQNQGLSIGEVIKSVGGVKVENVNHFLELLEEESKVDPVNISIVTDKSRVDYLAKESLLFDLNNLTIVNSKIQNISDGEILKEINNIKIESVADWEYIRYDLLPSKIVNIETEKQDYVFQVNKELEINVKEVSRSNIRKGLDLEGGTRVLLKPQGEFSASDQDVDNLMDIISDRLDIYGLADKRIRAANVDEDKLILIEIAGISKEEVEDFIATQGKFEAKIGEDVIFVGGEDVPFVCKDDGTCSGVRQCDFVSEGQYRCGFEFSIKLSPDAAKRHASITSKLDVIGGSGVGGHDSDGYLSKPLDLYLDEELIDTLQISSSLRGSEATDILISGSGFGDNQDAALNDALRSMEQLQTVMITGSLPFELEIVKIDSISPVFGETFLKNAIFAGLIALISVLLVVYIRYRSFKVIIPMGITLLSEIFIIMGFAGLFKWNLDLAAIAGIIASVGTGVDDQIVITDEIMRGKEQYFNWKEKLKRAFFIIFVAYAATVAAMLPLIWAVAGLLRGFAIATLIGVSIGVFITRPAFGAMLEKLMNK